MADKSAPENAATTREVAELRKVVMRMLDIMEDDKRRSMRAWGIFGGVMLGLFIATVVLAVSS